MTSYTLDQLPEIAKLVIEQAPSKILLFSAKMGAGKTTLISEICKQLGVTESISSPTYSLVNEYQGDENIIYHFDFYRIKDISEAYDMGIEEYLYQDAWIFIEWPDKIKSLLPDTSTHITIEIEPDGMRIISIL